MRSISGGLQAALLDAGTTLCFLLKIQATDGRVFGLTNLETPVPYDDGGSEIEYTPAMNRSGMKANANLEVGNAENMVLINVSGLFTSTEIEAGVLDYGRYWLYRMDFTKPELGHYIRDYGKVGRVMQHDQISGVIELRSLAQNLKQTFIDLYSITCRARFGSQVGQRRFPCMFDVTSLWTDCTVGIVDVDEPDRVFKATYSPVSGPKGVIPFKPALIQFTSGSNTGAYVETKYVEENPVGDGIISLVFATGYAIQSGDTFRMRPDCDKTKRSCIDYFDNYLWFRGENTIPLTEERKGGTPGANYPGFGSGIVGIPAEEP